MTDVNDRLEKRIFEKVTGIEKARKDTKPMPEGVKIPKCMRRTSEGGRCGVCGNNTLEGREDGHGVWHYRCPYCIAHQQPSPDPCPRCRCTAHEDIAGSVPPNYAENQMDKITHNPFRPAVEYYLCLRCGFKWNTPEYEKYLLTKAVEYILPTSEFSEEHKP